MRTMLMLSDVSVVLGAIFAFFTLLIFWVGIFDGSLQEMPESPKIKKRCFKIVSIDETIRAKIIANQIEVEFIGQEEESRLEVTEVTHCYVQERWFRKEKMWTGTTKTIYKLYVTKEKIKST